MDQIENALKRAQDMAAQGPAPATQSGGASVPATYSPSPPARPRSLEVAMATAGAAVDKWLGVKEGSFTIDKVKLKVDEIKVSLDLSEVKFGFGVRYSVAGRQTYSKSYDGVTEARGGKNWSQVVQQACQVDGTCKGQYDLADIPMTLLEDVIIPGDRTRKEDVALAGTKVGYTTPITGYLPFMALVNKIVPVYGARAVVNVKLIKTTRNGPTGSYEIMDFELLDN